MAELKIFEEGEVIYAREINDNFSALQKNNSDFTEEMERYLEEKIASIQSSVESVQQTLQNNIDALDAKKPIYIIEQGGNSSTWYKVYSNGWCEQGGKATVAWNESRTVTLPKAYKDSSYFVIASFCHSRNTDDNVMPFVRSNSQIGLYVSTAGAHSDWWSGAAYWETKGYVNLEVTNG